MGLIVGVVVLAAALATGAAFALPGLMAGTPTPEPGSPSADSPRPVTADLTVSGAIPGAAAARWDALRGRSVSDAYVDAVTDLVYEQTNYGYYSFNVRVVEADGDPATVESLVVVSFEMGDSGTVVYQHADGTPGILDIPLAAEGIWSGAYLTPGATDPVIMAMVWPGVGEGAALYLPSVSRVEFDRGTASFKKVYSFRTSLTGGDGWQDDRAAIVVYERMGDFWWDGFDSDTAAGLVRGLPADVKAEIEGFHDGQQLGFDDYVTQSMAFMGSLRQQTLAEVDSEPTFEWAGSATRSEFRSFLRDFYNRPLSLPAPPSAAATTPPSGAPACPAGMSLVSWTRYDDGSILLCSLDSRVTVVYTSVSQPGRTPTEVSFVGGGYVLKFPDGTLTYDGGQVVARDVSGATTATHRTSVAWVVGHGDQVAPTEQAACPVGSWQISRSTWNGGWLLVCGTDQGRPTRMEYSDATRGQGSSSEVQGGGAAYCANVSGTVACVYRGGEVTLGGESRTPTSQDWASQGATTDFESPKLAPGTWVTVLHSLNKQSVPLTDAYALAGQLSARWGVDVYVFDSSATPGMNPGYWALTLISFSSNESARAACSWVGREPGNECYGRQITG